MCIVCYTCSQESLLPPASAAQHDALTLSAKILSLSRTRLESIRTKLRGARLLSHPSKLSQVDPPTRISSLSSVLILHIGKVRQHGWVYAAHLLTILTRRHSAGTFSLILRRRHLSQLELLKLRLQLGGLALLTRSRLGVSRLSSLGQLVCSSKLLLHLRQVDASLPLSLTLGLILRLCQLLKECWVEIHPALLAGRTQLCNLGELLRGELVLSRIWRPVRGWPARLLVLTLGHTPLIVL